MIIGPEELVHHIQAYAPDVDADFIKKAYAFSWQAHSLQFRSSGDPYFSHPLAVASLLIKWRLDCHTIVAGLFHDILEDTSISFNEICEKFGHEVAQIVEGVTKISKIRFRCELSKQAENLRKFVLAVSHDIRVLIVKLADRLHNMRTLHHIADPSKRERIAQETLEIFAPLAARIGMNKLKDELETLAFSHLFPEAYAIIQKRLTLFETDVSIPSIETDLTKLLALLHAEVHGRQKTPYSIWLKMREKHISLDQLSDIMAFRVLVDTPSECYEALGIIHQAYSAVPERFKDYISTPKSNHYQSLHTCIIGPSHQRIEIQIRTHDMNQVAEWGLAAHWRYKKQDDLSRKNEYMRDLLDILEHASHPKEFLKHTKMEMFSDQVFCFTPQGGVMSLPKGATAIDFAYAIHASVGHRAQSCKINGQTLVLKTVLSNGDQVEIITGDREDPSSSWENSVVTGKARIHIRQFFRMQKKKEFLEIGKSQMEQECFRAHIVFDEEEFDSILPLFHKTSLDDLWRAVGEEHINPQDIILAKHPEALFQKKVGSPITGIHPGSIIHYAMCCHPLPGDSIVGVVLSKKDIKVHTDDCPTLSQVIDKSRIVDINWTSTQEWFACRFFIIFKNQTGAIATVTTTISQTDADILNLKVTQRTQEIWCVIIDVKVRDLEHFYIIQASLRALDLVQKVQRD